MPQKLETLAQKIVREANALKNRHTSEKGAKVNYTVIFPQSTPDYLQLIKEAATTGALLSENPSGFLFHVPSIKTVAGPLKIVKVRLPERGRTELGDADFTVKNYSAFKKKVHKKPGFRVMRIDDYELIELVDPRFKVRAYFTNKPMDKELGI
jgi:hypothetical protein